MPTLSKGLFLRNSVVFGLFLSSLTVTFGISTAAADERSFADPLNPISYVGQFLGQSVSEDTATPVSTTLGTAAQGSEYAVDIAEEVKIQESVQADDRTAARLRVLQRPLGEIEFERAPESARAPATAALSLKPALLITQSAHAARPRNRYAVAAQHNPLYFEEPNLERCGNTLGYAQTFVSACQFFGNALVIPYRVAQRPWCTIEYDRLECQSGGRLPCADPLRPSSKGLALETAVFTGLAFLLM
jgi:hypothetical protein